MKKNQLFVVPVLIKRSIVTYMYTYSYCCINNPLLPAFQVNTFLPVSTLALIFDTSTDPAL